MRILVVIPAYNEEKTIEKVIDGVRVSLPEADTLVVNDGSDDSTSELARKKGVTVLDMPYNLGIGGAMQAGYLYAWRNQYNVVCQVDGDGQHPPSELKKLVEPILEGRSDMVVGSRYLSKGGFRSTFQRRIGNKFFALLISLITGRVVTDPTSGFRAMNRKVIEFFAQQYPPDYPEAEALILLYKRNLSFEEIPIVMQERQGGTSSIGFIRAIYYMIKVTISIMIGSMRSVD